MNTPRAALRAVVALLAVVFVAGCESVPKSLYTPSGKPELTIRAPLSAIKSEIVADLVRYGYNVEADSDYMLRLSRPLQSGENIGASLSIGNAYSSNRRVTIYNFSQSNGEVHVVVSSMWQAQMPYGQVNQTELTDNAKVFNTFQEQLRLIRDKLEAKTAASSAL
jgi:hypothetical protein